MASNFILYYICSRHNSKPIPKLLIPYLVTLWKGVPLPYATKPLLTNYYDAACISVKTELYFVGKEYELATLVLLYIGIKY